MSQESRNLHKQYADGEITLNEWYKKAVKEPTKELVEKMSKSHYHICYVCKTPDEECLCDDPEGEETKCYPCFMDTNDR